MNTVQEPLTAPFPPPCSAEDAQHRDSSKDSTNNFHPFRCQFTFSDGRQCRSQRAQLCAHHASKNQSATADLPELQALCSDLTTATNINQALAQVFLLMAQGRIPQKQAVAFGYLSQLLLQTVPGIRSEFVSAFGYRPWKAKLKSSLESQQRNESPTPPEPPAAQPFDSHLADLRAEPAPSLASPLQSADGPATPNRAEPLPDPVPFHDYVGLVSRSRDLLDGKYDTTPEGRREANSLLTELELMKPPASKPPKGARASVIEHSASAANASQSPRESLSSCGESDDATSIVIPSEQRESRDLSVATPVNKTQLEQKTSPARPLRDKPAPPPKPRPEAPFETKASLWDGRYRPPTFVDPLKRPTAFEPKLRRMSSYQFRHFLQLQHVKSFFD